jgi:hypothetical protein
VLIKGFNVRVRTKLQEKWKKDSCLPIYKHSSAITRKKKRLKIVELIDMKIVFDCVYLRYVKYERGLFCMKNEEKYMTLLLNVFDLKTILENEWDWLINVVICYYMWKRVWWCENNMFLKKKMNPLLL